MLGDTHQRVAAIALDWQPRWLQEILRPQWGWMQGGATLTDVARAYREPDDSLADGRTSLVHSYYIDSPDPTHRGAVSQIVRYAKGTGSFIQEEGKLAKGRAERDRFHGQVALYFGILSHHIADLNTPVHVGRTLNAQLERKTHTGNFHTYYERELETYSREIELLPHNKPREHKQDRLSGELKCKVILSFTAPGNC